MEARLGDPSPRRKGKLVFRSQALGSESWQNRAGLEGASGVIEANGTRLPQGPSKPLSTAFRVILRLGSEPRTRRFFDE
jgi:hypothetical protein